ncbi:MAG TPA: enoyl-CoA hydratase-related protein [Myxococcota bacterium]
MSTAAVNSEPFVVSLTDEIVTITMQAPRGNALSPSTLKGLARALYQADQLIGDIDAPQARAVVLAGKPGIFCGGLDLKEGDAMDRPAVADFVDLFETVFLQLFSFRAPVIAALTGPAVAGGAILALACDERVAPLQGRFEMGLNEVVLGLPLPSAALEICRHSIRPDVHVEALMRGRRFNQAEALDRAMVDELAADVVAAATERAVGYKQVGLRAVSKVKLDLRQNALAWARSRAIESRRIFTECWFDPDMIARRKAVLASLTR